MRIWLTLDSIWTYLIDGVPGCRLWLSEPVCHPGEGWLSPEQGRSYRDAGKRILRHPQIDEIDKSIMWHFMPEIDMTEERWVRFDLIREHRRRVPEVFRCTWKMPIHIAPQEWFNLALDANEGDVAEAVHAQKVFDLPF